MNLRAIANRATRAVNPNIAGQALISTGYATAANGKQQPSYAAPVPVTLQAQALTKREVEHLDAMNLSNAVRVVYANTRLTGVDRIAKSGGDLVQFEGFLWLVVAVLEDWSATAGWCKVALSRQSVVVTGNTLTINGQEITIAGQPIGLPLGPNNPLTINGQPILIVSRTVEME